MFRHYLKIAALALIVFPEPITTALGLGLLAIVLLFPGSQKRLSRFKNLETLLARSLKPAEREKLGCFLVKKAAVLHRLKAAEFEPGKESPAPQAKCAGKVPGNKLIHSREVFAGSRSIATLDRKDDRFDGGRLYGEVQHHTLRNIPLPGQAHVNAVPVSPNGIELHTLRSSPYYSNALNRHAPAADCWKKRFFTPDEIVFHTLKSHGANV